MKVHSTLLYYVDRETHSMGIKRGEGAWCYKAQNKTFTTSSLAGGDSC